MNDSSLMNVKITVVDHIVCGGEVVNLIYISRSGPDFNFTFPFSRTKLKDFFLHFHFLNFQYSQDMVRKYGFPNQKWIELMFL